MPKPKYDPNEAINPARNMRRREAEAGMGEEPSKTTVVTQETKRSTGTMSQADFSGYGRKGMDKPKPAPKSPRRMYGD